MGRPKRVYELGAVNHVTGLKMLDKLNRLERIEDFEDSKELWSPRPGELSEVERREELEAIRRVIGLLERVVPQRFPRVREEKEKP